MYALTEANGPHSRMASTVPCMLVDSIHTLRVSKMRRGR